MNDNTTQNKPRTDGLSVASMVLGIISFAGGSLLVSTPGLIMGIISLKKIKRSNGLLAGRGYAITGIITSAINLALVVLIIMLLLTANISKENNENIKQANTNNKFYDSTRALPYKANEISFHSTRSEAVDALAEQFDKTPSWIKSHMGNTNDLTKIHKNLVNAMLMGQETSSLLNYTYNQKGKVNYSLVATMKKSWQEEDWRYKSEDKQLQALALMIQWVKEDCPRYEDSEATLNYIQENIDSW